MRLPDWQTRFSAFGIERESLPFRWGSNDCCLFAAASVEAITGVNPMASFERYGTLPGPRRAALRRVLRRLDKAGGLKALATHFLGAPVSPLLAAVGDVVVVMNEGQEMLGVCNGVNVLAPGKLGMAVLGMDAALAAWKI
jgi:hypothetical protein